ncbi:NAD(P)-dependent oxidoreductase [Mesorhizobium sp. M7A.F.Ca.US.006.01.1.1]|uniref:NAD-dependent epimerase/dehydratase family protein n=1 Tax=Mesorhizobium sp. M7A.F.Ca.US.006.01.1.1 TaxID=2496707 RepID=UPI000FCAA59D|nr:NAD(P)-dependent oxidoreductase [Mesorhizobium sp. M7A.F.Ca.US.006.01.1.1]RUZ77874.1 NAD(P)-dependent oxidoreductase [Mesorhizobium sp. M7A.F.Ca.US.006.01.1.1]
MVSKSILVTGANGLVGYDVVKRLVGQGRQVIAVDRSVSQVRVLTDRAFELEIGDIHKLHEIAFRYGIDAIIHCGGFSGPSLGRDNPALMFNVNVGGTLDVAELARQITIRSDRCRLLFCSSLTVYGNQAADDITEDFPLLAKQCYPSSKIAGEAIVSAYAEEHNVDAISLRIAGVYGPRRKTSCVLRLMISNALEGRPIHLPYGNGFPRQWVHVDDVVEGILLALDVNQPSIRKFNISAGVNPTIDEAASIIREAIPSADISLDEGADPDDVTLGRLSIDAARQELGFAPAVSLREGVMRLIQAIKDEHNL